MASICESFSIQTVWTRGPLTLNIPITHDFQVPGYHSVWDVWCEAGLPMLWRALFQGDFHHNSNPEERLFVHIKHATSWINQRNGVCFTLFILRSFVLKLMFPSYIWPDCVNRAHRHNLFEFENELKCKNQKYDFIVVLCLFYSQRYL